MASFVKVERNYGLHRDMLGVMEDDRSKEASKVSALVAHHEESAGDGPDRQYAVEVSPLAAGEWRKEWGDEKHPAHPSNNKPAK